ncbi:MAG: sigma-70 family RNA polymerase sigma factor [Acidimicrobiales bacterium]
MGETSRNEPTAKDLELILAVAKSTARTRGANHFEADEVAQATVVKLWMKWNHAHIRQARALPNGSWVAYIRSTAKNLHIDRIRAHQRRLARQTRASIFHEGNTITSATGWQVPATPCDSEWFVARSAIADEIRSLPPKQRAVAEGIFIREMNVAELADELNVQRQLVRKHLRAAKRTLCSRLAEAETEQQSR